MRTDLLELTTEALTALANPGFVKRAIKEIADGQAPQIEQDDDGTVRARYTDGQCATLPPARGLREAMCTCPASGWCRHRVTLVLAYQQWAGTQVEDNDDAHEWSPAHFDDTQLDALPAATRDIATRLAGARPAVRLHAWQADAPVPTAHLPMCTVRFFSRTNLLLARCDCKKGGSCEHVVLAVWAFRQAPALQSGVIELGAPAQSHDLDEAMRSRMSELSALLLPLWLDGTSQPPMALEARFEALRHRCVEAGWSWMVDAIDAVRRLLAAQHARASDFDPLRLLAAVAELQARLFAAQHMADSARDGAVPAMPAAQILGIGIKGEVELDHLRLVSLGAECWQGDDSEGVRIAFADPDAQTITVLERSWSITADKPGGAVMSRRVSGQQVRQLASSQVVTKGARRRANGAIDIAAGVRQTSVLPLSPRSWDALDAPLRQPSARALAAWLTEADPDFARPRHAIEHLHVLPIARVLDWGWDAATQTLHANIVAAETEADDVVQLALQHRAAAPGAVDAMACVLSNAWGAPTAVAGIAHMESGRLHLRPLGMMTTQRAVILDAEQVARQSLSPRDVAEESTASHAHAADVLALLATWLRQGLRHQGAHALARARSQVDALRHAGLQRAAAELSDVLDEMRGSDRASLPARLMRLALLLQGTLSR